MTLPTSDLPWDVFADREVTREATWYARVFDFVNRLRTTADPYSSYWKASAVNPTSVPDSTHTAIPLDTIIFDSDGVGIDSHGGYTSPVAGVFFISATVGFSLFGGQREACQIGRNGAISTIDGGYQLVPRNAGADSVCSGATVISLSAGDRLAIFGYQETAATVNTLTSTGSRACMTVLRIA